MYGDTSSSNSTSNIEYYKINVCGYDKSLNLVRLSIVTYDNVNKKSTKFHGKKILKLKVGFTLMTISSRSNTRSVSSYWYISYSGHLGSAKKYSKSNMIQLPLLLQSFKCSATCKKI